jgi:hypothetical protein
VFGLGVEARALAHRAELHLIPQLTTGAAPPPASAPPRPQNFQETWRQLDRRLHDLQALSNAGSAARAAVGRLLEQAMGRAGSSSGGGGGSSSDNSGDQSGGGSGAWQAEQAAADGPAGTWPGVGSIGIGPQR